MIYSTTHQFNMKINKIINYYKVEDLFSLEAFLKNNESMLILLDKLKPILEEVFPSKEYALRIVKDPEYEDYEDLVVTIKLDFKKESVKNIVNKLDAVDFKFRQIKRKYANLDNIVIDVESL